MTEVQRLAKIMLLKDLLKEYELRAKYNTDNHDYDKYTALDWAIESLEQEPKIGWIPVSEKKPDYPCFATDEYNQVFIPMGVVNIGERSYDGKNFNFNFDVDEFLKGEETIIDGKKAYLLPRRIIAWQPLPEPYKESEGE